MSVLALIGIVQALVTPGKRTTESILATSSSHEIRSGQIGLSIALRNPGAQFEYQRSLPLHWLCGLRMTVVSIMENGAGSVEVLALPAFPKTRSTSGKVLSSLSCRIS